MSSSSPGAKRFRACAGTSSGTGSLLDGGPVQYQWNRIVEYTVARAYDTSMRRWVMRSLDCAYVYFKGGLLCGALTYSEHSDALLLKVDTRANVDDMPLPYNVRATIKSAHAGPGRASDALKTTLGMLYLTLAADNRAVWKLSLVGRREDSVLPGFSVNEHFCVRAFRRAADANVRFQGRELCLQDAAQMLCSVYGKAAHCLAADDAAMDVEAGGAGTAAHAEQLSMPDLMSWMLMHTGVELVFSRYTHTALGVGGDPAGAECSASAWYGGAAWTSAQDRAALFSLVKSQCSIMKVDLDADEDFYVTLHDQAFACSSCSWHAQRCTVDGKVHLSVEAVYNVLVTMENLRVERISADEIGLYCRPLLQSEEMMAMAFGGMTKHRGPGSAGCLAACYRCSPHVNAVFHKNLNVIRSYVVHMNTSQTARDQIMYLSAHGKRLFAYLCKVLHDAIASSASRRRPLSQQDVTRGLVVLKYFTYMYHEINRVTDTLPRVCDSLAPIFQLPYTLAAQTSAPDDEPKRAVLGDRSTTNEPRAAVHVTALAVSRGCRSTSSAASSGSAGQSSQTLRGGDPWFEMKSIDLTRPNLVCNFATGYETFSGSTRVQTIIPTRPRPQCVMDVFGFSDGPISRSLEAKAQAKESDKELVEEGTTTGTGTATGTGTGAGTGSAGASAETGAGSGIVNALYEDLPAGMEHARTIIERTLDRALNPTCPVCGIDIWLEEGCMMVLCSSCAHYSCFACTKPHLASNMRHKVSFDSMSPLDVIKTMRTLALSNTLLVPQLNHAVVCRSDRELRANMTLYDASAPCASRLVRYVASPEYSRAVTRHATPPAFSVNDLNHKDTRCPVYFTPDKVVPAHICSSRYKEVHERIGGERGAMLVMRAVRCLGEALAFHTFDDALAKAHVETVLGLMLTDTYEHPKAIIQDFCRAMAPHVETFKKSLKMLNPHAAAFPFGDNIFEQQLRAMIHV